MKLKNPSLRQHLKRLVGYRYYGDLVISPEVRVNPAAFSEEEFPVFCPQCEYQLRGLPSQCCPECGQAFDRGRLLVQQYINEGASRLNRRVRLATKILLTTMIVSLVACLATIFIVDRQFRATLTMPATFRVALVLMAIQVASLIPLIALTLRGLRHRRKLIQRVFDAIDRRDPVVVNAQRYRYLLPTFGTAITLAAVSCEMIDKVGWPVRFRWLHLGYGIGVVALTIVLIACAVKAIRDLRVRR